MKYFSMFILERIFFDSVSAWETFDQFVWPHLSQFSNCFLCTVLYCDFSFFLFQKDLSESSDNIEEPLPHTDNNMYNIESVHRIAIWASVLQYNHSF